VRRIPKRVSGKTAQFDVNLLYRIGKAKKVLTDLSGTYLDAYFRIGHNGLEPALIDIGDEHFSGLIMPVSDALLTRPPVLGWGT
jgi:hypothetical protein